MQHKYMNSINGSLTVICQQSPVSGNRYFVRAMSSAIFISLFLLYSPLLFSQNIAVSAITTDWWPQNNQDATNFTTPNGWYYHSTPGAETLAFDGGVDEGTAIATQFGFGDNYTSFNLKFNATIPSTEE